MAALKQVRQRRTIVVSRSTYPNSGFHGSHWLGDNTSLWPDLYLSIPGLLAMNMYRHTHTHEHLHRCRSSALSLTHKDTWGMVAGLVFPLSALIFAASMARPHPSFACDGTVRLLASRLLHNDLPLTK